jgi:hypothetical protein
MLEQFSADRNRLADISEEASRFAHALGESDIAARLLVERSKLVAEEFNLAVLGEFKRGKSTLANALIGADLLPVAVVPLTSVVTSIRHGPEPRACVYHLDGRSVQVSPSELDSYTTERGNPENTKAVERIEVEVPTKLLPPGVRLVDTPGVGSVYETNTAATLEYLPQVDAALFVLGADQPVGEAELGFLHRMRQHVEKLFFVLNKIDLLTPEEREEAIAFSRVALERALGGASIRLYPLSARVALRARPANDEEALNASGIGVLESDLGSFLAADCGTVLLARTRRRIAAALGDLAGRVELRRRGALMPLTSLDARIREFEAQSERIAWNQAAIDGLFAEARRRLLAALEDSRAPFVEERAPLLLASLERVYVAAPRGRRALIARMQRALEEGVQRAVEEWVEQQTTPVRKEVGGLLARLEGEANAMIDQVRRLVRDLFATDVTPNLDLAPLSVEPPVAQVDSAFSLMLDEVPLLLPRPLARRIIRRRFIQAIPEELARNLAVITAEFRQRFLDAERRFQYEFRERVAAMLASLREVLGRAREDRGREETDVVRLTEELDRRAEALSVLRARLMDAVRVAA